MNKHHLLSRLGNIDTHTRLPLVELTGFGRVLVENHTGVIEYSLEEIVIRVNFGSLRILGQNMKLEEMRREQLVISGQIDGVFVYRR